MINIRTLLGDIGVPFWTAGKNVTEGWTTIACPLCGDRSNHGGFNPEGVGYSCFRCGKHGITKIISTFVGYEQARALISEYGDPLHINKHQESERVAIVEWPPPASQSTMPSLHAQYLHGRGFDPRQVRGLYDVRCVYQTGDFKYRLLIPVYLDWRLMTYVGRDVTNQSALRYKNLAERRSVAPAKECVYNIDRVHEFAIICEGIFDAWRFGTHGVALFGIQFTAKQTKLLANKLKRAVICFDSEYQAQQKADELAEALAFQGVDIEIMLLDRNDPGDMSQAEADEIRSVIL